MRYEPTWESVSTHPLPQWYDDAKFGIFLHWGLYSVPGWAEQVEDIQALLKQHGPEAMLRHNPYAEWYANTMRIEGSPTWQHHRDTYGAEFPYERFRETFDRESSVADLGALADLLRSTGAEYVVLTTKHHEGFTLWPSDLEHPRMGTYHAQRDLVGDLTSEVRARGMRMGLYYSGGYDWPFNDAVLQHPADTMLAVPAGPEYVAYASGHVRELIDRYEPSVLWNDVAWPGGGNLAELFAHYYNTVPDGVVDDRWLESTIKPSGVQAATARALGAVVQAAWRLIPEDKKGLTFPAAHHFDFETPEYSHFPEIHEKKWETTRGVGHSFGANRNERPEDIITTTELVRTFVDVVSKNGNMLLGIGPRPDGTIPEEQQVPVRGMGEWLAVNADAVKATRPWVRAEGRTREGEDVRYTRRGTEVYAILLETPASRRVTLPLSAPEARVEMLGVGELEVDAGSEGLTVVLPAQLPVSPAHALRVSGTSVAPIE
jgi:alpha-L-fucosidase